MPIFSATWGPLAGAMLDCGLLAFVVLAMWLALALEHAMERAAVRYQWQGRTWVNAYRTCHLTRR